MSTSPIISLFDIELGLEEEVKPIPRSKRHKSNKKSHKKEDKHDIKMQPM